jgi:hypothetical protein
VTVKKSHRKNHVMHLGAGIALAAILVVTLFAASQPQAAASGIAVVPQWPQQMTRAGMGPANTIRVATDAEYWPMESMNGTQIVGYDIDLMNALALKLNATVVYTNVPWGGIFTGLLNGEYDAIISSVSALPIRDGIMDFTLPYVTFGAHDDIAIAVQQGNDALRHPLNQALSQLRSEGFLAKMVAGINGDVPAWHAHLPDWPYVAPGAGSTLVYTDTQQSPLIVQVPSGAVTQTILLAYTDTGAASPPAGYTFAGRAFQLDAYHDGVLLSSQPFGVPVTVTLHYTDTDVAKTDEAGLRLLYWNAEARRWEDASTTCTPFSSYDRHPGENWLAVPICHLSKFALFGQHRVYLPVVLRN